MAVLLSSAKAFLSVRNWKSACKILALLVTFTGLSVLFPGKTTVEVNNYGTRHNLLVQSDRFENVPENELKTILFWNDAYGVREYDIGFGREPFFRYKCPDTRCYATANRSHLKSVDLFDAVVIHQRGIDWKDMPEKRSPKQRYIQWVMESAQYLYMDIHTLDNYFNWTMSYRLDSDFPLPYGSVVKVKDHPPAGSPELDKMIKEFGWKNQHLAHNRTNKANAAWFVSHCATQARRERYAKAMKKYMHIDVFGKCAKSFHNKQERKTCSRTNEWDCYKMLETNYRFYLSFENSVCRDYVTEKFFNILRYDVIPIVFNGADLATYTPPHSAISVFDFDSPKKLVTHLQEVSNDDALYASYFWWRQFYEVRNSPEDRAQPYCDLCSRLNSSKKDEKQIYKDMFHWWVTESKCKKLKAPE